MAIRPFHKSSTKYYGPYVIIGRVGVVAYKLLLHVDVSIHHTFHLSQLKRCRDVLAAISHPSVL